MARRVLFHPDTEYRDVREIRVDGRRALRWEAHGGLVPQGALVAAVAAGERIYLLTAFPGHSHYRWVFDRLVLEFRLP